jgi:quercetin dioxygenase-like cupin family protein
MRSSTRRAACATNARRSTGPRCGCHTDSLFHHALGRPYGHGVPDERPAKTEKTLTRTTAEWHMGSLFEWHVDGASSGGALSLAEVRVRAGGEPPLHCTPGRDEIFYVLEGELTFMRGVEQIEAGPGMCVVLPRGIQHGFAVHTPEARMLVMATPAGLEDAFRAYSEPATERALPPAPHGPPDEAYMEALSAEFARYGVTFVGPPLPVLLER